MRGWSNDSLRPYDPAATNSRDVNKPNETNSWQSLNDPNSFTQIPNYQMPSGSPAVPGSIGDYDATPIPVQMNSNLPTFVKFKYNPPTKSATQPAVARHDYDEVIQLAPEPEQQTMQTQIRTVSSLDFGGRPPPEMPVYVASQSSSEASQQVYDDDVEIVMPKEHQANPFQAQMQDEQEAETKAPVPARILARKVQEPFVAFPKGLQYQQWPPRHFGERAGLPTKVPIIEVLGNRLYFPHATPYPAQRALIGQSFRAFTEGKTAILESPTGTGKSLALLTSALSFQSQASCLARVVYSSRTHPQLKQLIEELKQLPYDPQMVYLSARKHVCLNQKVLSTPGDTNVACMLARERDECPFYRKQVPFPVRFIRSKFNLEDLKAYGLETMTCPYQVQKKLLEIAELVIAPYNYVIDPSANIGFNQWDIVIFDEGHNIMNACRETPEIDFTYDNVVHVLEDALKCPPSDTHLKTIQQMGQLALSIKDWMDWKKAQIKDSTVQFLTDKKPQETLDKLGIDPADTETRKTEMLVWANLAMNAVEEKVRMYRPPSLVHFALETVGFLTFLNEHNVDDFRIAYLRDTTTFRVLLMNPGVVFTPISRLVRSTVLMSGTLSPIDCFRKELQTPFEIAVSANHVITKDQLFMTTFCQIGQYPLITTLYREIQEHGDEIMKAVWEALRILLPTIPGGALLFAPSYSVIKLLKKYERPVGRHVMYEDSARDAKEIFREYLSHKYSLLIGVCRGRMSEGIDFTDDQCRAVFMLGIPYPSRNDINIDLKLQYQNESKDRVEGNEWYTAETFRSMLQSVGRCIRHKDDYGAIILMDMRYRSHIGKFALWQQRSYVSDAMEPATLGRTLAAFFARNAQSADTTTKLLCRACKKFIFEIDSSVLQGVETKECQIGQVIKCPRAAKLNALIGDETEDGLIELNCPECGAVVGAIVEGQKVVAVSQIATGGGKTLEDVLRKA